MSENCLFDLSSSTETATTTNPSSAMQNIPSTLSPAAMQSAQTISQLVENNLKLVSFIVRRILAQYGLYSDDTAKNIEADLNQEGVRGLFRAAQKFDPALGKFSSYACVWIRKYVQKAVEDICNYRRRTVSIDTPVGNDEEADASLGDFLPDENSPKVFDTVAQLDDKAYISDLLRKLPERERRIVELRFGLLDATEHPLREIGAEMGISVQRVHILLNRTLGRLRQMAA